MRRRMKQGISVVLSAAMVLSSGGNAGAAYVVENDSGVEASVGTEDTEGEKEKEEVAKGEENVEEGEFPAGEESTEEEFSEGEEDVEKEDISEGETSESEEEAEEEESSEREGTVEEEETSEREGAAEEEESSEDEKDVQEEESSKGEETVEEEESPEGEEESSEQEETGKEESSGQENVIETEESSEQEEIAEETGTEKEGEQEEETESAEDIAGEESGEEETSAVEEETSKETIGETENTKEETSETKEIVKETEAVKETIENVKNPVLSNVSNIMLAAMAEVDGAEEFLNFLNDSTNTTNTTYTVSSSIELAGANVSPTINKVTTVSSGISLTIGDTVISSRSRLGFTTGNNGEATVEVVGISSLQGGRFEIGGFNGAGTEQTDKKVHMILRDSSSIVATTGFLISSSSDLVINDSANMSVKADKYLTAKGKLTGSGNGTITLEEGAKVTVPDGTLNDQGKPFSSIGEVIVGATDAEPAEDTLSAGDYVWNEDNSCFTKAAVDNSLTAEKLQEQLVDSTTGTISINENLTFNLDAVLSQEKTIEIAENKTLTVTGTINSNGNSLFFTGKGTVVVENEKGLQGKIRLGKATADSVTCYLKDNSSMLLLKGGLYILKNGTLKMDAQSKIEGADGGQTFNIVSGATFDIEQGATITLKKNDKFLSSGTDNKFNDQGMSFAPNGEITVLSEETEPAENQLTAGDYVWNGTCFCKEKPDEPSGITTEADLKAALESTTAQTITVTGDITLSGTVSLGARHTLNVAEGVTLTIEGCIDTRYTKDDGNVSAYQPVFTGAGTIKLAGTDDSLQGSFSIETKQLTIEEGSSILIDKGSLVIKNGSTLTVKSSLGIKAGRKQSIQIEEGGILTGTANAGIQLDAEAFVTGAAGRFNDQGILLAANEKADVVTSDKEPAGNQLTAGTYMWNGTCFCKEKPDEPSGITTEADLKAALESTTAQTITVTGDITLSGTVSLGAKHTLNVAEGVTLTIEGCIDTRYTKDDGNTSAYQPIFTGAGTIKLTGADDSLQGSFSVETKQLTIEEGSSILIDKGSLIIENGSTVTVKSSLGIKAGRKQSIQIEEGGILTGTANAGIQLDAEAFVTGAAGRFNDQGILLATNESATVVESDKEPVDNQLTAGTYLWDNTASCFIKPSTKLSVATAADLVKALNDQSITAIAVAGNITLNEAVVMSVDKSLTINSGVQLTLANKITTNGKKLNIGGTGTVTVQECFDAGNKHLDTLQGSIYIGTGTNDKITFNLTENSTIRSGGTMEIGAGATFNMSSTSQVISNTTGQTYTINSGSTLNIEPGAKFTILEKDKITAPNRFSDQGKAFAAETQVVVLAEDADPQENQLTAGSYIWNGTCFAKPLSKITVTTETDLVKALNDQSITAITVEGNVTLNEAITMPVDKTLSINSGVQLTLANKITTNGKKLNIGGTGTVAVQECFDTENKHLDTLQGSIYIGTGANDKVTFNLTGNSTIRSAGTMEIGAGATFNMSSTSQIISNKTGQTYTIDKGSVLNIESGAKFTIIEGDKIKAPNRFSDQGKAFAAEDQVVVLAEGADPQENQLTAGSYIWNGTCFAKPLSKITVTTETDLVKALNDGSITAITVAGNITLNEAVVMSVDKTFSISSGIQLTLANKITTNGKKLNIGGTGTVAVQECFDAENKHLDTLQGSIYIGTGANDKITFNLTENSTIRSGGTMEIGAGATFNMSSTSQVISSRAGQTYTINSGSTLNIESGAKFTILENDKITAPNRFNDQGKAFAAEDQVAVLAGEADPQENQLTAGSYIWNGTCFAKPQSKATVTTAADLVKALNDQSITAITVAGNITLNEAVTMPVDKTLTIGNGIQLTLANKITTNGKKLNIGGTGTVTAQECFDTENKHLDTLQGSVYIGTGTNDKITFSLTANSTIRSAGTMEIGAGATFNMSSTSQVISNRSGQTYTISSGSTLKIEPGAKFTILESDKITAPNRFNDQGKAFAAESQVVVLAGEAVPQENQLTAGSYIWNGTCFAKPLSKITVMTEADLVKALNDESITAITVAGNITLNESVTMPVDKTLTIGNEIQLTLANKVTTNGKKLNIGGTGTVTAQECFDAENKHLDTLQGSIYIGTGANDKITFNLTGNSTIRSAGTIEIGAGATFNMSSASQVISNRSGQTYTINSGSTLNIESGAKFTVLENDKITAPNRFSDQGKTFAAEEQVVVLAGESDPQENQLTAGSYVWNGTYFAKTSTRISVATEADLVKALNDENITAITVAGDITLNEAVTMSVDKTLSIAGGVQLTLANKITTNGKKLNLGGTGTVAVQECFDAENNHLDTLQGSVYIGTGANDKITFNLTGNSTIRSAGTVAVGAGAVVNMSAGSQILGNKDGQTYVIDSGSTLKIETGAKFIVREKDKLTAPNRFSDQGKAFAIETQVEAGAAATPAADNQLTAGEYIWNGTCFAKEKLELSTWLKSELESTAFSTIAVTENITLAEEVTMGANHVLNVAEGKTLTITGKILTDKGRLTLTGKGTVRLQGDTDCLSGKIDIGYLPEGVTEDFIHVIVEGSSGIIPDNEVRIRNGAWLEINSPAGIRVNANRLLTVEAGGRLTGGANGRIILVKDGKITDANGDGRFSDQGKAFATTSLVTVGAASDPAADNQLTAGTYTWNKTRFEKPIPDPLPETKLENGILVLSKDSVNAGSTEGWAWDAEKNTLNVNYRFKDIKQIRFAKSEPAVIRINGDVALTPDAGMDAVVTADGLTVRADEAYTLTLNGRLNVNGGLTVINKTVLNLSASREDSMIIAEGNIMVKDNSVVTAVNSGTGCAVRTSGSFTVKDGAEVNLTSRGNTAVLRASGKISVGGPDASLTVINEGQGPAVNKAPDTTSYENVRITASLSSTGRPSVEYQEADIQTYRYLKIRKMTELGDTPTAAEVENAVDSIKPDDYEAINDVVGQLYRLEESEKAKVKEETIIKLDQMLQEATGIRPQLNLSVSANGTTPNQQIKRAEIYGALVALGVTADMDSSDTEIQFTVEQIEKEQEAYTTFVCALTVNGVNLGLQMPVTIKVELPPEYFPLGADRLHLRGRRGMTRQFVAMALSDPEQTQVDRWLDFTYDGKDNTAAFRTDVLGTFSLVRKAGSTKPGSGSGSSGGSGSGGGKGASLSGQAAGPGSAPGSSEGNWIQDSVGWWYQYADQSYPADGWFELEYSGSRNWYYFSQDGYMLMGWLLSDGRWYYLNPASDGTQGRMLTGWQLVDGKWYYLNENSDGTKGAMLTDTWIETYYVNSDGVWEEGKKK